LFTPSSDSGLGHAD